MSYSITYKVAVYSSAHSKAISDSSTSKADSKPDSATHHIICTKRQCSAKLISHDQKAKNRKTMLVK